MRTPEHPPLEPITGIVATFQRHGLTVAVGGSAVLAALGLIDRVRD